MGKRYLIDTNALIYFLKAALPQNGFLFVQEILDTVPVISFVTQIELLGYPSISNTEEAFAKQIIEVASVVFISNAIIEQTILLRKNHRVKLPDAIIAATAIVNNLILVTSNEKDFLKVPNLKVTNPFTL